MAKQLTDETLRMDIVLNGNKAQAQLGKLQKQQHDLRRANEGLRKEKQKLIRQGKQETEAYKRVTSQIRANNVALKENKQAQSKLRKEIGLTGLTTRQLKKEKKELYILMDNFSPNTPQWKQYNKELQKVNKRLADVKAQMNGTAGVINKIKKSFGGLLGILGVGFSVQAVFQGIKKLVSINAELSDIQSDVAKTTGLSNREINQLTKSLKTFDTRTPVNELLKLSVEAGRLGKDSVEDIEEFVKTADKIRVALGDDLNGDVNENVALIGKLAKQYKVGKKDGASFGESMERVGSGINEVSASGANQAGFLVDYLKRLVGISSQTDIAASAQIGFAAAFDEAGQNVEVSATSMNQLIVKMYEDAASFAEVAGVSQEKFNKLLAEDGNEALLLFFEGLNKTDGGLAGMTKTLKGLGVQGTRNVASLTAIAANTENVRKKQEIASRAIKEGTSLTAEFTKKNDNLAGTLDKIGNVFSNFVKRSGIISFFDGIAKGFLSIIRPAQDVTEKIKSQQIELFRLETRLFNVNTKQEERVKIIQKLKKEYPKLLENIDEETVSNDELKIAISKVNDELINRIVIAQEQAKVDEQNRIVAEKSSKFAKARIDLENEIASIRQRYTKFNLDAQKTEIENAEALEKFITKNAGLARSGNEQSIKDRTRLKTLIGQLQLSEISLSEAQQATTEILSNRDKVLEKLGLTQTEQTETTIETEEEQQKAIARTVAFLRERIKIENQLLEEATTRNEAAPIQDRIALLEKELNAILGIEEKAKKRRLTEKEKEALEILRIQTDLQKMLDEFFEDQLLKDEIKHLSKIEQEKRLAEAAIERELQDNLEKANLLNVQREELSEIELQLLLDLEAKKEIALQEVRDRFNQQQRDNDKIHKDELAQSQEEYNERIAEADKRLNAAKREAASAGIGILQSFVKENTALGKVLFLVQKGLAAKEIIINASEAIAKIKAGVAIANSKALAASPFTGGLPFTATNTAIGLKEILATKISAAASLANIASQAIAGFEDGLYPDKNGRVNVTRTDGKKFNAQFAGPTRTGIVSQPTVFRDKLVSEAGPELIVDNRTLRRVDPRVIQHIYDVRDNRLRGYESGQFPTLPTPIVPGNNNESQEQLLAMTGMLMNTLTQLNIHLEKGITATAKIGYDEAEAIDDLNTERNDSNINGTLNS